jgi:hypothetical protein
LKESFYQASETYSEWRKHSGAMRTAAGVSASFAGWSSRPEVKLVGFPKSERSMDCLDVAWAFQLTRAQRGSTTDSLTANFWVNVSQGVDRKPWGTPGCLLSNGMWYSFRCDCCLDGLDCLRIQGFPLDVAIASLSSTQAKDLAGEAFCLPCMATCLLSVFYSPYATWWQGTPS